MSKLPSSKQIIKVLVNNGFTFISPACRQAGNVEVMPSTKKETELSLCLLRRKKFLWVHFVQSSGNQD